MKDELDIDERGRKLYTSFHFNNGVIKIQRGMESQLTLPEKRACACLKKESEDDLLESQSSESDDDETQCEKKRFARELHDGQHQATSSKNMKQTMWRDCQTQLSEKERKNKMLEMMLGQILMRTFSRITGTKLCYTVQQYIV